MRNKKMLLVAVAMALLFTATTAMAVVNPVDARIVQPQSSGYSLYMQYMHTEYYYLLATDSVSNRPTKCRNNCTTHSAIYDSKWFVECGCCQSPITSNEWHGLGDYTYFYEDYEHDISSVRLIARPDSRVAGSTVKGTFYGSR